VKTDRTTTRRILLGREGWRPPGFETPCHCGSSKQYKKCHALIDMRAKSTLAAWMHQADQVAAAMQMLRTCQSTPSSE